MFVHSALYKVTLLNKVFRHVEILFIQGIHLYLAGLLLVMQGLFTFRQPIASLQGTDFYLGRIMFLHVERPYTTVAGKRRWKRKKG